jgi:hypothetical protein
MRLTCSIIAALCWSVGATYAQTSETQQRQACTGDALRLCGSFIPDRDKIRQCLASKRAELSPACAAVMDGGSGKDRDGDRARQRQGMRPN